MQISFRKALLLLSSLLCVGCSSTQNGDGPSDDETSDAAPLRSVTVDDAASGNRQLLIGSEDCYPVTLLDSEGNVNKEGRQKLSKNEALTFHYQRVGCNSDTCKREFVTYAAVQYPKDSILQSWMADILAQYYKDVTRLLDIKVNGGRIETNADGDVEYKNQGCRAYEGPLGGDGKEMWDYYQGRVWIIGRDRPDEHGPEGRYGCFIYRCWQSPHLASYFAAYSTDETQTPLHCVVTFDRVSGQQLELDDVIREESLPEFNDLLADAASTRHFQLRNQKRDDLSIELGECDYSSPIQPNAIGFTQEGLAVSTGALPFDQLAWATHVLIIPYEKINDLLKDPYRR